MSQDGVLYGEKDYKMFRCMLDRCRLKVSDSFLRRRVVTELRGDK